MLNTLGGITFDAYGTLVQLENPFELLREALKRRGYGVPLEVVREAFVQEMIYYRANHMEGKDTDSLYALRKRCASLLFDSLREREGTNAISGPMSGLRFLLNPSGSGPFRRRLTSFPGVIPRALRRR